MASDHSETPHQPIQHYRLMLHEGNNFIENSLDYSLMLIQVSHPEVLQSPTIAPPQKRSAQSKLVIRRVQTKSEKRHPLQPIFLFDQLADFQD